MSSKESHATHFIDGKWIEGGGHSFDSYDPATGTLIWTGHEASAQEIDAAVTTAKEAFDSWSALPLDRRVAYLYHFQQIVTDQRDVLAEAISEEIGKPLWEAKAEIDSMISKVEISIRAYHQRCTTVIKEIVQTAKRSVTRFKPHGVIAILGPFNFPVHLPHAHIIPALLAGNTIVFKPSEYAPKLSTLLMHYWEEVSLPKGVFNMVQGGKNVGQTLSTHPAIGGLFFTGSLKTGQWLSEYYGKQLGKILVLELGGNNPLVISDIKDVESAVQLTILSSYLTSGQRCTCARRLIVVEGSTGEAFIESLIEKVKAIAVGEYTKDPEPFMGPVISERSAKALIETQRDLQNRGGDSLVEMHHLKPGTGLLSPGLMDVTVVSEGVDEEFFGPLLQLIRVKNFEVAIEEANRTNYGLTAGLCSNRIEEYEQFYRRIRAGIINWNSPLIGASGEAPFGGIGNSGNYRPSGFFAADYCSYPVASIE